MLLVDDNEQVRHVTRRFLERLGYEVLEAPDPEATLAVCDSYGGDIDLLLTDLVMPVMDGVTLARQVKARRPTINVLYMSGYPPGTAMDTGCVVPEGGQYIQKPFDFHALGTAVREALRTRRRPSADNA